MAQLPQQEKLEGSSNYPTWKFGTMMQLIKEDLWELIDSEDLNLNDAKIKKRDQRALASICLGLTPQLFVLVAVRREISPRISVTTATSMVTSHVIAEKGGEVRRRETQLVHRQAKG